MTEKRTRDVVDGVVGALRDRSPASPQTEDAPAAHPTHQRVRRPEARFGVDDLMELSNAELLRVATEVDPSDLVLICGSRGAGELTERLFALLPESVGRALIGALKAQGRPDPGTANEALERAALLVDSAD